MGEQTQHITIALFSNESDISKFINILVNTYLIKVIEKNIYSNARPYKLYFINEYPHFYSKEFIKKYQNYIYDFEHSNSLGYPYENLADSDLTHYQLEVEFYEYFRFLIDENAPIEILKNKINKQTLMQFDIFFYFDIFLNKYVLFQVITSDIYNLLRSYFFYINDRKNYLLYAKEFMQSNNGLISEECEDLYQKNFYYYEKLMVQTLNPSVFIDLIKYSDCFSFDEDTILNLNYYFLGKHNLKLKNDFHWNRINKLYLNFDN